MRVIADIEAERGTLSVMMRSAPARVLAATELQPDDYATPKHHALFVTMRQMVQRNVPVDQITVLGELSTNDLLGEGDGRVDRPFVFETAHSEHPHVNNIGEYIRRLKAKSRLRKFAVACERYGEGAHKALDDKFVDNALLRMLKEQEGGTTPTLSSAQLADQFDKRWCEMGDSKQSLYLETGMHCWDSRGSNKPARGLRRSGMTVLGGKSGGGKTSLAMQTVLSLVKRERHVFVASLEMTWMQLMLKMASVELGIPSDELEEPWKLTTEQHDSVRRFASWLHDQRLEVWSSPYASVRELQFRIRASHIVDPLDFVLCDYIQLLTADDRRRSREEEVREIVRACTGLAMETDAAVMALAQLNRENEKREDRRPRMSDLRESDSIAHYAVQVAMIHVPDLDEPDKQELHVIKDRFGKRREISMTFAPEQQRFDF